MASIVSVRRPVDRGRAPASASYFETRRAAFTDPWDVVLDADLTVSEKRQILADWLAAAQAAGDRPGGHAGAAGAAASWAALAEGLRLLDAESAAPPHARPSHLKPAARRRSARTG